MVPRDAEVYLKAQDTKAILSAFDEFVAQKILLQGRLTWKEGKVYLHIIGKAAHAQEPRNGQNAATTWRPSYNNLILRCGGQLYQVHG